VRAAGRDHGGHADDQPADGLELATPPTRAFGEPGGGDSVAVPVVGTGVPAGEHPWGRWWCSRRGHNPLLLVVVSALWWAGPVAVGGRQATGPAMAIDGRHDHGQVMPKQ
jgi:hypothetical protein